MLILALWYSVVCHMHRAVSGLMLWHVAGPSGRNKGGLPVAQLAARCAGWLCLCTREMLTVLGASFIKAG